jgi:anti-anti-sigma factor
MSLVEPAVHPPVSHSSRPAGLSLRVTRPHPGTVVIEASGRLDAVQAPRLAEFLHCRLRGTLQRVVLDLTGLSLLDEAGIAVLARANLVAEHRRIELRIRIGRDGEAARALAELGRRLPTVVAVTGNWPPRLSPHLH